MSRANDYNLYAAATARPAVLNRVGERQAVDTAGHLNIREQQGNV
jgi:hypothetical protein